MHVFIQLKVISQQTWNKTVSSHQSSHYLCVVFRLWARCCHHVVGGSQTSGSCSEIKAGKVLSVCFAAFCVTSLRDDAATLRFKLLSPCDVNLLLNALAFSTTEPRHDRPERDNSSKLQIVRLPVEMQITTTFHSHSEPTVRWWQTPRSVINDLGQLGCSCGLWCVFSSSERVNGPVLGDRMWVRACTQTGHFRDTCPLLWSFLWTASEDRNWLPQPAIYSPHTIHVFTLSTTPLCVSLIVNLSMCWCGCSHQ